MLLFLINKPSASTKQKETDQSEACGFNYCNKCHKNLIVKFHISVTLTCVKIVLATLNMCPLNAS